MEEAAPVVDNGLQDDREAVIAIVKLLGALGQDEDRGVGTVDGPQAAKEAHLTEVSDDQGSWLSLFKIILYIFLLKNPHFLQLMCKVPGGMDTWLILLLP